MSLDIKKEAEELRRLYKEDPRSSKFNVLILGETGTGKSEIFKTARTPVHMDSFDPGGTKGLVDEINKGDIIADISYEVENPYKPKQFKSWKYDFDHREKSGYFAQFGTYGLDSSTMWAACIMNRIQEKDGRAGEPPKWAKDYDPQKIIIRNWIKRILALPCDVIVTGHLEPIEDKVTDEIKWRYMTTGKGTIIIPLEFDEIWVTHTKEKSSGLTYQIITKATGPYLAASRMGKGGIFDTYEVPNIKALLKKAKRDYQDKPKLF